MPAHALLLDVSDVTMSDLEAPLLVTAEPPRASRFSSWLKKGLRLSTPAALASPDDAHAHLHAAAVSSRVGGTAAAAVANLSNTSACRAACQR